MILFQTLLLPLLAPLLISCLNEGGVRERVCFPWHNRVDVNWTWVNSVSEFHFPWVHKLQLYRMAADWFSLPVGKLPDASLQLSCMKLSTSGDGVGFNGTKIHFSTLVDKDETFWWLNQLNPYTIGARIRILHTDNKSFVLGYACWNDGLATWTVWSTTPELSSEQLKVVKDILIQVGFNPDKYGAVLKYGEQNCFGINLI